MGARLCLHSTTCHGKEMEKKKLEKKQAGPVLQEIPDGRLVNLFYVQIFLNVSLITSLAISYINNSRVEYEMLHEVNPYLLVYLDFLTLENFHLDATIMILIRTLFRCRNTLIVRLSSFHLKCSANALN